MMHRQPEVIVPGGCARGLTVPVIVRVVLPLVLLTIAFLGSAKAEMRPRLLEMAEIRREMYKARGHLLFVHLWASWCGPCLDELPLINRFARAARARGATVISLSLDSDARGVAGVPAVLRARAPGLTRFVAHFEDPGQFMSLFSRSWEGAIPALFAFDRAGKLRASLVGEVAPSELESLLARMNRPPSSPRRSRRHAGHMSRAAGSDPSPPAPGRRRLSVTCTPSRRFRRLAAISPW
jgi:thiol-disulfide isomerase/thioredoxin